LRSHDFYDVKNPQGIKEFGVQLRRLREGKDLSQQELADRADIAKITVQRIENSKYAVTLDVLISLAEALELPLKDLVDFAYPKTRRK
jgi:transcriptional regulator with XRE-family HTH domain